MSIRPALLLAALTLGTLGASLGCGGDGGIADAGHDASVDGGDSAIAVVLAPPDIPWLADGVPPIGLAPCPEGWREVHGGDVVECDPYPEAGALVCDEGEAHFPGEAGCRPIGDACPVGDYATSLPSTGPVVYVSAGASAGGDGSLAAPYGALGDVPWVSVASGMTVALGKGTYAGTLPLSAGVQVVGACARETVVTGITAPVPSVVSVTSAGEPAELRNLTIRDAPQSAVWIRDGRRLNLRGVLIERAHGFGVVSDGAHTQVELADVVVRDMEAAPGDPAQAGVGVHARAAGSLEARRLIVANVRAVGIFVRDAGTVVTVSDTVVRNTRSNPRDRREGRGIDVGRGARVDATRLLLSGNRTVGFACRGGGSAATLVDTVIRDTQPQEADGTSGSGVIVGDGAELSATRLLVASNRKAGMAVFDTDTTAHLVDTVIRDTEPESSDLGEGVGLSVQRGARCEATRLLVSRNSAAGIVVVRAESVLSLTDALVHDTRPSPAPGNVGVGLGLQDGGHLAATRMVVADNREIGLHVSGLGTRADLSDVVIHDTQPRSTGQIHGRGIQAQHGAAVDGVRIEVVRGFALGVAAVRGAAVVLQDIAILDVQASACAATTCRSASYGHGVGAYSGSLSLTRFRIANAAICGVMIAPAEGGFESASIDLRAGVISGAAIGACVQVDGYDLSRLTTDVSYSDNATSLDSTMLPVPGPVDLGAL